MVAVPLGTSVIAPDRNDNPVEFIGFEDGDLDVTDAEVDIGRTLTDASIETVFVVSTLQFENSTYVPWSCTQPGSRQVSVYDDKNLTIPLSFVYGKPGKFTPGYLSFPTPLRYLSLTTLSQKVAWLKKGLALRLRVRNDSISEEMWSNSTGDLRRSFIHRIVNETLTRSFQRVTRTEDYLDGAIYVRGDETIEYKGVSSLPGNVPKYSKCDRSHLALNETSDGVSYPYTVCSSWRPLENDNTSIVIFWTFYGLIVFLTILCGIFAVLVSQYVGRSISLYEERHNAVTFPNELDPIPTSLTIMSILRARNFLPHKIKNSVYILPTIFILVLDIALYLATIFAPFKFFDLNYLLEDISVFSTCWQSSNVHYMLVCFWLGISLHILATLGVFIDVCCSNKMKHTTKWRKSMRSFYTYLSPHFYVMMNSFLGVIFYTVVGLSLNYLAIFIGILALAKVVVFDILKFARVKKGFSRYILRRIAIIVLLFVALIYFQNLIVNFEQLSDVKGIISFFVPTATILIGLVGPIRGEKLIKFTTGQKTDAKLYFLNRMKTLQALAREGASKQTVAVKPDAPTAQPNSDTNSETSV